jgi:hypothetical protein
VDPLITIINANLKNHINQSIDNHISWLLNHDWSCVVDLKNVDDISLFNFYNGVTIVWRNNQVAVLENSRCCLATAPIKLSEDGKVTLSFSLLEGFIRALNTVGTDGTWKGEPITNKSTGIVDINSSAVKEIKSGAETFDKHECLKNMSGLEFWLNPEQNHLVTDNNNKVSQISSQSPNNIVLKQYVDDKLPEFQNHDQTLFFEPNQFLQYQGKELNWLFNQEHNMIMFLAIEPYEYVSPIDPQTLFKINQNKNEYTLMYTRTKEEIGDYKNREFTYRFFIKHQYINGQHYETVNFVDLLTTQWIYKNERPGPTVFFLITQQIKDGRIKIQNYNYNKKWFIFEEINQDINLNGTDDPIQMYIGNNYHGKIKEMFIFNRHMTSQNIFDDQSVKWIMAYLKYKYAIQENLVDLKNG